MNNALDANVNRLTVATESSVGRMIGSPITNDSPASRRSRVDPSSCSIGGSGAWIRRRKSTDPRYEKASPSIASGAPSTWTRMPPMVGPATDASERLPLSRAIASTYRSRSVTDTNSVFHDRSKMTASVPLRKPTT